MALAQKLLIRQNQSLVMTPQLSQSIRLLAMSAAELETFVEGEIERNPFLDRAQNSEALEVRRLPAEADAEGAQIGGELATSTKELASDLGTSVENAFPDDDAYHERRINQLTGERDRQRDRARDLPASTGHEPLDGDIADRTPPMVGLVDHLEAQLVLSGCSQSCALVAREIIAGLDEAGYLTESLDALLERLGAPVDVGEEALLLVQSFEPSGVAARNVAECLSLQLAARDRLDPAMQVVLDHLDLLAQRDFAALRRLTGLDDEDLHDALCEIQALDPRPGRAFDSAELRPVSPDVLVNQNEQGGWRVELNGDTLPRVLVDETYAATICGKGSKEDQAFVDRCISDASWLTRSLDQRARTILKVAREIVRQQDRFLLHGVQHLKPLTLKQVADAINMHESSVSRVTSNKFMMTPRGMFELKYFFTSSIAAEDGKAEHSSEAVRDRIRRMVDGESAEAVLSDDAIVTALRLDGIDIARRTVAKYRDAMNIPSSVQRRREKRLVARVAGHATNDPPSSHIPR